MSMLVNALQKKQTVVTTENGAKTFSSSLNACVDLFFMGGAIRKRSEQDVIALFTRAYAEDPAIALQLLAYIRDCRGGMGERETFRKIIKHLATTGVTFDPRAIPELGRWDDVYVLFNTPYEQQAIEMIAQALQNGNGLCAKWMDRQGTNAYKVRSHMNMRAGVYRRLLAALTRVVETQMCNKQWSEIKYSAVPSVANVKYNKAFLRNDEIRRRQFLGKAIKGEEKINSSVAFPHDIIKMMFPNRHNYYGSNGKLMPDRNETAIAMWNQLPNYMDGSEMRLLPICDTSGSMVGVPLWISLALGIYISERNEGVFKDAFVTFSERPTLQYTKGDLYSRLSQIEAIHPSNTNLEATFRLILSTALKHNIPANELPTHLVIISDMEFDQACRRPTATLYKNIKLLYKDAGYEMPNIVFWNVQSRQNNVPIRFNQDGVGLISGASPSILTALLGGKINPVEIMMKAIESDRYKLLIK